MKTKELAPVELACGPLHKNQAFDMTLSVTPCIQPREAPSIMDWAKK
jgi:hypothetical protein